MCVVSPKMLEVYDKMDEKNKKITYQSRFHKDMDLLPRTTTSLSWSLAIALALHPRFFDSVHTVCVLDRKEC